MIRPAACCCGGWEETSRPAPATQRTTPAQRAVERQGLRGLDPGAGGRVLPGQRAVSHHAFPRGPCNGGP